MIVSSLPVDKEQIAARYDALEPLRADVFGDHLHHGLYETGTEPPALAQKKLIVKVADLGGVRPGLRLVDVGCGAGAAARVFAADYGCDVTGYTLSAVEAARAREATTRPNPRFVHGDFLANDLDDGSVDVVVAIDAAEHFADRAALFRAAQRALVPGGRFVVASPLACDRPWAWERTRLLQPWCEDVGVPVLLDEGEQRRLLWDTGFDVGATHDLTHLVAKTWSTVLRNALVARRGDVGLLRAAARTWLAETLRTLRYGVVVATKRTK